MALERELSRSLQAAAASDAVHTALAAAEGGGDSSEGAGAREGAARLAELRRVAQLEGINASFQRHITVEFELLGERGVVLKVAWATELVSAGIAQIRIGARR